MYLHRTCVIRYNEFLRRATPGCEKDLRQIIDADRQKEIERNRAALVPVIDTLLRCKRQNLALKGHRDDGPLDSIVFPNVHTLLTILATLPVTTAEPERLFSKLNSTLTAIRSTMSEEWLEFLLLLQVHRERTPTIEKIIDSFALIKRR